MDTLESTLKNARSTLYHKGYLTSVSQDVRTLPTSQAQLQRQSSGSRWLSAETLAGKIGAPKVRLAYYRQITGLLGELQALLPYLQQEGQGEIVEQLLKTYARPNNTAALTSLLTPEEAAEVEAQRADSRGGREHNRGYGYLSPESGVSYAIGRKKTATAQAYILPLPQTASNSKDEPALGQILVNSKPISQYFPSDADRSQILRPFALTECVGKYNVFILVSGSGMSSQTQAATVACARALAARDLSDDQAARKILSKGE
jgi:ribosomal protein S9